MEKWLATWNIKIAEAQNEVVTHLRRILVHPNGPEEEKEKAALWKEVRVQCRDVLRRADKAGIRMEEHEGDRVATEEVIAMHSDEAKRNVQKEMQAAAVAQEQKEAEAAEEASRKQERDDYLLSVKGAKKFQKCYRVWKGRRRLRARLYHCVTKRFSGGKQGCANSCMCSRGAQQCTRTLETLFTRSC